MKKNLIALLVISILLSHTAFAGEWFEFHAEVEEVFKEETVEGDNDPGDAGNLKLETEAPVIHRETRYGVGYRNDQGVQLKNGWFWIDKYGDNTKQCYYFDKYGFLVTDDEIGGYTVNSDGQRLKQNADTEDDIELQEFTLAGPGAENPFAIQLFDADKFSEKSTSSEGELFEHINATSSYAYRLASGSSAEGISIEGYASENEEEKRETDEEGKVLETVAQETTTAAAENDEESNSISRGSINNIGAGGPNMGGDMGNGGGTIIAGDANTIRKY